MANLVPNISPNNVDVPLQIIIYVNSVLRENSGGILAMVTITINQNLVLQFIFTSWVANV